MVLCRLEELPLGINHDVVEEGLCSMGRGDGVELHLLGLANRTLETLAPAFCFFAGVPPLLPALAVAFAAFLWPAAVGAGCARI